MEERTKIYLTRLAVGSLGLITLLVLTLDGDISSKGSLPVMAFIGGYLLALRP